MCFFQRRYEWVGLLEHHPALFAKAEELEDKIGNDEQETPYSWIEDLPLSKVRKKTGDIIRKRAMQVADEIMVRSGRSDPQDMLSLTSCGLFCGK